MRPESSRLGEYTRQESSAERGAVRLPDDCYQLPLGLGESWDLRSRSQGAIRIRLRANSLV